VGCCVDPKRFFEGESFFKNTKKKLFAFEMPPTNCLPNLLSQLKYERIGFCNFFERFVVGKACV
jgi:hypothetical protein